MNDAISLAALQEYFGDSFEKVQQFTDMLQAEGETRGLIGPREIDRLWERHILNSAALVQYLPKAGTLADIGSGAGLPGIVVACMIPEVTCYLIEPMERRCIWLNEVKDKIGLHNVIVERGRAEQYHGKLSVDIVTARAVANLAKLSKWILPLLKNGGSMMILKGTNVAQEIDPALPILKKFNMSTPEIITATTIAGAESTTVLRSLRVKK